MQGIGMAGIDGERLPAALFRLRQLPRLQQPKTRLEVRGRRVAVRSALSLGARSLGAGSLGGLFGGCLGGVRRC